MDPILEIAQEHGVKVIEDAAQAHGAEYHGRRAGSIGDLACFSFYPSKNLGCYGDGGAVVGSDVALIEQVRLLRDHGRTSKYEHAELGWGYRLDAMQAAILGAKLPHLDAWNDARRAAAYRYNELLAGMDVVTPRELNGVCAVYHCYVIRTPHRDEVVVRLRSQGIGAGIHYPIPLHLQPAYEHLGHQLGDFPVSEACSQEVLTLPLFPEITEEQQARVVDAIRMGIRD